MNLVHGKFRISENDNLTQIGKNGIYIQEETPKTGGRTSLVTITYAISDEAYEYLNYIKNLKTGRIADRPIITLLKSTLPPTHKNAEIVHKLARHLDTKKLAGDETVHNNIVNSLQETEKRSGMPLKELIDNLIKIERKDVAHLDGCLLIDQLTRESDTPSKRRHLIETFTHLWVQQETITITSYPRVLEITQKANSNECTSTEPLHN